MPVSLTVSVVVAPDYPACLYGSQRYAVDATYRQTDATGKETRWTEHRLHANREHAIAHANHITTPENIRVVD